uniref:OTU domain-containing protein n=1 Tax=Ditylenchus dipsaci TaxID=166011 RepID=A0A915EI87_9BILA
MTQKHNHFGDKSRVDLKRMQGNVQEQAISSKEAPRAILGRAIESVDEDSRPLIRRSYVARNIRYIRHTAKLEPANPKTLQDLKIEEPYKMRGKEVFLKYDGWNGDERILLFSTDKCLDLLVAIKNWGCDATRVLPYESPSGRLVLIRPRKIDRTSSKIEAFKRRLDFEKANGMRLRNKCRRKGSKEFYDNNDAFRREVNLILALAFTPIEEVSMAFTKLREYLEDSTFAEQIPRRARAECGRKRRCGSEKESSEFRRRLFRVWLYVCKNEEGRTVFRKSIEIVSVKTGPELRFNPLTNQQQIEAVRQIRLRLSSSDQIRLLKHKNFATSGRPIKVQSILGDGNCGFRSLSYCLFGSESLHKFVRIRIAEYLAEHQDDEWLNLFLDEPIEKHIEKIRTPAKNASKRRNIAAMWTLRPLQRPLASMCFSSRPWLLNLLASAK